MAFVFYNPNPQGKKIGDCTVRAISKLLGTTWEDTYLGLCLEGLEKLDMPSANYVWGSFLYKHGYRRHVIPDSCPDCFTIGDFCKRNPSGSFLLATGSHVVAVVNGDYYDTWDSGDDVPIYYWEKGV